MYTDNDNRPADVTADVREPAAQTVPAPEAGAAAPVKKGFSTFSIPALVMLALMLAVFAVELSLSVRKVNLMNLFTSQFIGTKNFEKLTGTANYSLALRGSLVYRLIQLGAGGGLAAGLVALFYAMRKPRVVLTFACLWLIPACLPYLTTSIAAAGTLLTDSSGILFSYCTTVLQTTSVFCFCGGIFTYLNLKKKGRPGGGPYYGLLIGALVYLLSFLSTKELFVGMIGIRGITLDGFNYRMLINQQFGVGAAGGVMKVFMQFIIAIIPLIVLSVLARKKSTKGKMTLNTLWVLLAIPAGLTIAYLLNLVLTGNRLDRIGSSVYSSILATLIGGSFGGLIAYSFIHLLRRVPCFLFALIATVLSASMSCLITQYLLMSQAGLRDTIWPQVLTAAFDGRLILIVSVLAFALRDWHEARPGSLVIAMALLTGAFVWGEINAASLFNNRVFPVSVLVYQVTKNATAAVAENAAVAQAQANAARAGLRWLLAVPPLLLGAGGAWMMRRAFDTQEGIEK